MAKRYLQNTDRTAGYSFDKKRGVEGSFAYGQQVEFRINPNNITLAKEGYIEAADANSGGVIASKIFDSCRNDGSDGDLYFAGDTKIYKRTPETRTARGTWSVFSSDSSLVKARGIIYKDDINAMLITDSESIHKISDANGTPTYNGDHIHVLEDINDTSGAGANTYNVPTSITESAVNEYSFEPEIDPIYSIKVYLTAKSSANLTLTLHNNANEVMATKTLATGDQVVGYNEFVFDEPVKVTAKPSPQTYHFHLVESGTGATVKTDTANDLSTGHVITYGTALSPAEFHPIVEFLQYVCIGNGRYLAVWEPLSDDPTKQEFLSHKLVFPSNYKVIGVANYDEYLAIAAYKTNNGESSATEFGKNGTEGIIFFWDGTSETYNYFVKIPEGAPESITSYKNVLYYIASGGLYAYAGGQPVIIRTMPEVDNFTSGFSNYTEDVWLQAPYKGIALQDNILNIGYPWRTANGSLKIGVYTWGTKDKNFNESFGYSYMPSTGDNTTTTTGGLSPKPARGITHLATYGQSMFVCYEDFEPAISTYRVEVINRRNSYPNDSDTQGVVENLIYDGKRPWKDKLAIYYKLTFESLPASCSVTPKYKINRESNWNYGTAVTTAGSTETSLHINKRFREIQTGYDLVGSSTSTPTITSDTLFIDDLEQEAI